MRAGLLLSFVLFTHTAFAAQEPQFVIDDSMLRIAWHEDGVLGLVLNEGATAEFEEFTADHIGRPVAVVWDGIAWPPFTLYDVITSGQLRINDPEKALIDRVAAFEDRAVPEGQ